MISKISIDGFKGLDHFELPHLSRVTLLGGRNNVGKTSVLEAMFMFIDKITPQMIFRQFPWRGVNIVHMEPDSMWAPVFNKYNLERPITISSLINGCEEKMTIKYNSQYASLTIPVDESKQEGKPMQIRTDQQPISSYALDICYDDENAKSQTAHVLLGPKGMDVKFDSMQVKRRHACYIGARIAANPSQDAQFFGQLDILGKQDTIIEFLRIIEPGLKNLSSIMIGGDTPLIHGDIGLGRKIPIAFMGDGVAKLLSIILAIATSKNGVVLIDECENGIHYSVMPKIWKAIALAAREFDCQVIATTHSYECIEAACEGLSGDTEDDFSFIRIDRIGDKISAKRFDYGLLKTALESNMEVR